MSWRLRIYTESLTTGLKEVTRDKSVNSHKGVQVPTQVGGMYDRADTHRQIAVWG